MNALEMFHSDKDSQREEFFTLVQTVILSSLTFLITVVFPFIVDGFAEGRLVGLDAFLVVKVH